MNIGLSSKINNHPIRSRSGFQIIKLKEIMISTIFDVLNQVPTATTK